MGKEGYDPVPSLEQHSEPAASSPVAGSSDSEEDNEQFAKKYISAVNPQLAAQVIETLTLLGIPKPAKYVFKWNEKHYHAISLFQQACFESNLSIKWAERQVKSYITLLNRKFYAGSTLDAYWKAFKQVGQSLGHTIKPRMQKLFSIC